MISADVGDVLGSPVWTVLATVLAAVAIWVSVWLYRRQRTRKSLSYAIKVTELVSVHQAAKGRIKILFDEEEIGRVHLVEARIENDGNVPITLQDFQQAFVLDLGEGATALTADVTARTPDDLPVRVSPNLNQVEIQPLLLNPGDGLRIKMFARDLQKKPVPHCRIVGISKLRDAVAEHQRQKERQRTVLKRLLLGDDLLGLVLGGVLFVLAVFVVIPALHFFDNKTVSVPPVPKTKTVVKLKGGGKLCGTILHTGNQKIVVQLAGSGKIRALNLSEVKSIRDDRC